MHQLTGTRQKTTGNPPGKKLTFPPVVGTFEENQKRRAMLIAKQRAAQQSVHPTKATPRQTESLVNKIVGLFSRLRG